MDREILNQEIKSLNEQIDELTKLAEIFGKNIGKKLTKRQLGKTPSPHYGGKSQIYWANEYISFHNPVVPEDIQRLAQSIDTKAKTIRALKEVLINPEVFIQKRLQVEKLFETAEGALSTLADEYYPITSDERLLTAICGKYPHKHTPHRRSY